LLKAFEVSLKHLPADKKLDVSVLHGHGANTVAKYGEDGIGYSGHKHQRGEKVIAIVDNYGYVLASYTIAPVNINDCNRLYRSMGAQISIPPKAYASEGDGIFHHRASFLKFYL